MEKGIQIHKMMKPDPDDGEPDRKLDRMLSRLPPALIFLVKSDHRKEGITTCLGEWKSELRIC